MPERSPKVLVVDDDELVRRLIGALLKDLGCDVIGEEAEGEAALETFNAQQPDLTLLDIDMPGVNGLEVLQCIQVLAPGAAVVMLTAMSDTAVAEHCLVNGAQGYIRKGIDPESLRQEIAEQLELLTTQASG